MNRLMRTSLIVVSMCFMAMTSSVTPEATFDKKKSLADLTPAEKRAAFMHMMSSCDCSWNGITLHGKVEIVESFPDIKVEIVNSFSDIKVHWVESFPDDCGEWEKVESFPDFKIQIVESFPDLKVEIVSSFPGMND